MLIKLHYFFFNAGKIDGKRYIKRRFVISRLKNLWNWILGVAPLIIFGPTIAKQIGFAAVTVGLMYTILPLAGLFAKTLGGVIADKFNEKKLVFMLAIFSCFISALCMTLIQTPIVRKKTTLLCYSDVFLSTCNEHIVKMRRIVIANKNNNSVNINCEVDNDS